MSKADYTIRLVSRDACAQILFQWHYLRHVKLSFKSGVNYGLFKGDRLVGVCIYTGFPVPELARGMYGLARDDQKGLFELSRLCLVPDVQASEHNLASWFVSRTLRELRKTHAVRAVLSYADDDHHKGVVYRACNFKYYGLTASKKDFFVKQPDGTYCKLSRGKTKGVEGEWRPRSRKHRFALTFDKKLSIKWAEVTQ